MNANYFSKRYFCLFVLLTMFVNLFFGQNMQIQGEVKDKSGECIIGASVVVEGTNNGTITDFDGKFVLSDVSANAIIRVSYVGYISSSMKASSIMNFVLKEDTEILDEVVVVGYGTTKKNNISGAVSTVKVSELPIAASASVGAMLRGRSSGVNITQNGANPGAALSISVRGGLSGQAPLIVIDGVPQVSSKTVSTGTVYSGGAKDNALINLNPNDIETIDILKDASSAAIYGSDASGGVILITTKRGKSGKPDISYSGSIAFQYMKDVPKFLNARDFMIEQNKVFDELGRSDDKYYSDEQITNFVGDGTNWMDEVTRTGIVQEHNFSLSSGTDKTKYLFSLSYFDHKGIAKNNSMNRITGRLNVDQTINKLLKVGISSTFSQIKYNDVPLGNQRQNNSALIYSAMTFIPTVPVYDEDGKFSDNPIRSIYPNPVSLLEITDQTKSRDLFVSGYLEFKPFKDLTFRATVGVDMKDVQADQYIPTTTKIGYNMNGQASKQNAKNQMDLLNIIGTYTKKIKEVHDVNLMAGFEYKRSSWEGMGVVASQFPYDGALMNNLGISEQEKPDISSNRGANEMASFIARFNYSLASKYILTINLRVDGSSNFSKEHQWGAFPGISAAWRVKEENWLKNLDWLYNLKLRVGVGQTGNAGNLTGINSYYKVSQGAFNPNGSLVNGIGLSKLGNNNLKWETITDYNIGIDWGIFNNRLSGTVDLYQRMRKDVILSRKLLSYHEIKSIDYNSAEVYRSRGIDLNINSINFDNKNFGWFTDVNFSFYRNHTIKRDPEFLPKVYQDNIERWGNIYGYRTNGLIQMDKTYSHLPKSGAGAILYEDMYGYKLDDKGEKMRDNDGRYIRLNGADGILDEADMVVLANSTPIPFSVNNTFRWKNWDANIYFYGSLNGWKINDLKLLSVYGIQDITYGINVIEEVKNRWSLANPNGNLPGVAEANSGVDPNNSDFFLEKAWYMRLDNISVGYTFPSKWFKDKIRSVRLYASGRNLAVFTPYGGMDPETDNGIGAYPNQASYAIGLDVKF